MNWEEACNYIWHTVNDAFILRIVNGVVEYQYVGRDEWRIWCPAVDETIYLINPFEKGREVNPFCGPLQPPPSKVILKIKRGEIMYTEEDLLDSVWLAKSGGEYIFSLRGNRLYYSRVGSEYWASFFSVEAVLPHLGSGWTFVRKINEDKQCVVLRKIKQMEKRQTWQRNQQS